MALATDATWEVRTTGNDANGGGFRASSPGTSVDRSQQDSPHVTIDGTTITGVLDATRQRIILTGYAVNSADPGNHVQISGGTATAGVYEVVTVDVGTNGWNVDRIAGAAGGNTVIGRMGGAFASPGKVAGVKAAGNQVWIKSGTYVLSATSNVSGGRVVESTGGSGVVYSKWSGYTSTRGDGAPTRPVLQAGAASVVLFNVGSAGNRSWIEGLEFSAGGFTITEGIRNDGDFTVVTNCAFGAGLGYGYRGNAGSKAIVRRCYATGCASACFAGAANDRITYCFADAPTGGSGAFWYTSAAGAGFFNCVARGGTATHFNTSQNGLRCVNCVSYAAAADAFSGSVGTGHVYSGCVVWNCGDRAFEGAAASAQILQNCAHGGTGTRYDSAEIPSANVLNFITLTADPFTAASATPPDFTLNNLAGGGALLRAVQTSMPNALGVSWLAPGAFQPTTAAVAAGGRLLGPSVLITPGGRV